MSLQKQQLNFTNWLRNPKNNPPLPDVDNQRMQIYRELFFNNIDSTLRNAFPILHQVLSAKDWQTLCEDFFALHQCHTPHLSHLPAEFVCHLKQQIDITIPDWVIELAEWEWSELELFLAQDMDTTATGNDPLRQIPVVSPLVRLHKCRYPVHHIGDQYIPDIPSDQIYYLLAWRKPDHSIGFMQLTQLTARILEIMQVNQQHKTGYTGYQLLQQLAQHQNVHSEHSIIQGGSHCLKHLYKNQIIIGSERAAALENQP